MTESHWTCQSHSQLHEVSSLLAWKCLEDLSLVQIHKQSHEAEVCEMFICLDFCCWLIVWQYLIYQIWLYYCLSWLSSLQWCQHLDSQIKSCQHKKNKWLSNSIFNHWTIYSQSSVWQFWLLFRLSLPAWIVNSYYWQ